MLAVLAVLPLLLTALASPVQKRYTRAYIVSGRDGKCVSAAPKTGVGSPVISVDCAQASLWDINPGSGSVIMSGTDLALDAGTNPGNNGLLKVWTSYPGLYQQTWYLTDDNRIAITGGDQCLDEGDNGIQTYQCTTGNTNQVFYVQPNGGTPSGGGQPQPTPNPGDGIPVGPVYPDPPNGGRRLHVYQRNDLCLTVQNGYAGIGSQVAISSCFANNDPNAQFQLWDLPSSTGSVKLHGTGLCLDAGDNPSDGSGLKVWTCYDGLLQQTWTYNNQKLSLSNGQCADIQSGSQPGTQKPYNSLRNVQTWQCFADNTNQIFQLY